MSQRKSFTNLIAISTLLVVFAAPSGAIPTSGEESIAPSPVANLVPQGWFPMRSLPLGQSPMAQGLRCTTCVEASALSNLLFVPNHGQWPAEVRFQMRGASGTWWFTDETVWVTVIRGTEGTRGTENSELSTQHSELRPRSPCHLVTLSPCHLQGVALKLTFPGLSPTARLVPSNEQSAKMNYFLGSDPARWAANVSTYAALRWEGVYPGVDLEFRGGRIAMPADWLQRHLRIEGADGVRLDERGRLVAETAVGSVALSSALHPSSFRLRPSDDPADLLYSTFLGGSGGDYVHSIQLGPDGSIYVTGSTESSDFPVTPGAFDTEINYGLDVFVSRLSADGSSLLYSTFLGGRGNDTAWSLALGPDGSAYVSGSTASYDFPTTPDAYDLICNPCGEDEFGDSTDVFVTRLSANGSRLLYSTFLGTRGNENSIGLVVGPDRSAYVTGWTTGSFPVTPGAFDTTDNGGYREVFISRLSPDGSGLAYSTYLGGGERDYGYDIALGADGSAYVTGSTASFDFPVTPGAYDTTCSGCPDDDDVFVSRLSADGSSLVYSTFIGGIESESGYGIVVSPDGSAYVAGYTVSYDFPATPGAFDPTHNGGDDAFVSKLSPNGSSLLFSSFLGGSTTDTGYGIALGPDGTVYVGGDSYSTDFPTTPGAYDTTHNGGSTDVFVSRLTPNGSGLLYSTFLGGSSSDTPYYNNIAVGSDGSAYIGGYTYSSDFPITPDALDTIFGYNEAFVTRLNPDLPTLHISHIDPRYQPSGQGYRIGVEVEVVDAANVPIVGAQVRLSIGLPNARQVQVTGRTGAEGHFSLVGMTQLRGTYTFTVTWVSKAGIVYAPSQNVETSDSVTIP